MKKRVLQISDLRKETEQIHDAIVEAGYVVLAQIGTADDIPALGQAARPDVVVVAVSSPGEFIFGQIRRLIELYPCPVVMFAGKSTDEITREAVRSGVAAYIVDGFHPDRVGNILHLAMARFDEVQGLRTELQSTKEALNERKLVDRAKGILMKQNNIPEEKAYRTLRSMAMSQNLKMAEVARTVISMEKALTEK